VCWRGLWSGCDPYAARIPVLVAGMMKVIDSGIPM
jgi:hypothetical protein